LNIIIFTSAIIYYETSVGDIKRKIFSTGYIASVFGLFVDNNINIIYQNVIDNFEKN